jgi:hypothetical protein
MLGFCTGRILLKNFLTSKSESCKDLSKQKSLWAYFPGRLGDQAFYP